MKLSPETRARERPQRYPLPVPQQQQAPPSRQPDQQAAAYADELHPLNDD